MKYLVTNKTDAGGDLSLVRLDEAMKIISSWRLVQISLVTSNNDPHRNKILAVKLGNKDFITGQFTQYVFQITESEPKDFSFNIGILGSLLQNNLLIGYDMKGVLKSLYTVGIVPRRVYDIVISEQMLTLGYKGVADNVKDVIKKRTLIDIEESGVEPYELVQDVRRYQLEEAEKNGCIRGLMLENSFIPSLAYLEWCGFHLDREAWRRRLSNSQELLAKQKQALDNYVLSHDVLSKKFVSDYSEPSLFDEISSTVDFECNVDWGSQNSVMPVLKEIGFDTKNKRSIEKVFASQEGIADDFVNAYKQYSATSQELSTYGENYLREINPATNRVHIEYNQLGSVTGRLSASSSILGISEKTGKGCFTAESGNVLISCDYKSQEPRIQAWMWKEPKLIDAIRENVDIYSMYAKLIFPKELKDVSVKDVLKVCPEYRKQAKTLANAIVYGVSAKKFAAMLNIDEETAEKKLKSIRGALTGRTNFRKKASSLLKKDGYILVNEKTGHRVYWPEWSNWMEEQEKMDDAFWVDYNIYHKGSGDSVYYMVKHHLEERNNWFDENILNYPVQGTGVLILKRAACILFNAIYDRGLFGKVKLCVFKHDEITCESPKELAEDVCNLMKDVMMKAASGFYGYIDFPVEKLISTEWM